MLSVVIGLCVQLIGRRTTNALLVVVTLLSSLITVPATTPGQEVAELSFRDRATDLIILNNETQLRGILIPASRGGMLVRSEWLQTNAPKFLAEHVQPQWQAVQAAEPVDSALRESLRKDLDRLRQMPGFDVQHAGLLDEVIVKLEPELRQLPKLLILQLPGNHVRRRQVQPERNQRIGFLSLLNDLPNVESAAWRDLADQLAQIPPATLRTVIPQKNESAAAAGDLEHQRTAVLAAVEYRLGRTAKFVQTGSAVLPEDGPVDLQGLMAQMLGQGLQSQLADLLNEAGGGPANQPEQPGGSVAMGSTAPVSARKLAESRGLRTLVVSAFSANVPGGTATVVRRLYRQNDQGEWPIMFAASGKSTVAELTEAEQKAVSDDPQIREITALFGGLGVGNGDIAGALQMGSVVRRAAGQSSAVLEEFITQALNGRMRGTFVETIPVIEIKAAR